jgi:nicotinate-nucleotide pyrophosphorylase (carboxylating)
MKALRPFLNQALKEDGARRDRTTAAVVPEALKARGEILAKAGGVLAGLPLVAEIYRLLDKRCRVTALKSEGARVKPGMKVALLRGPARTLLSGERVALNLLSRLSGIATATRKFADQVAGPRIYDTRKTIPLLRPLERYAVRVGGGQNHRFNLAGHVLIKDNHLALAGGVAACVAAARKKYGPREFIEVEVESLRQLREALAAGADILLLDNRSPRVLKSMLKEVPKGVQTEISGGLTPANIRRFSRLPVDRFSSGSLTHSAPALDFSMDLRLS